MERARKLLEIKQQRAEKLERWSKDPATYIFEACTTKDEHDADNPRKLFPRKPYLEELLNIFHNGETAEHIIKSRQLMVTWMACAYISWLCRFTPDRLAFVQSKKEEDAANLVYNSHPSIGRISFIETNLPKWLRQDIKWSYCQGIYPNGSKVWAIPQGPQHYESYVPSFVFNDEASLQEKWEQGHAALKPCIEGGGKVRTVATVRMPMPYSVEMSNFNKETAEEIRKGFWKFRSKSGASAHAIHYTTDENKDPATEKGKKWYDQQVEGYVGGTNSYLWKQHMEIDFEAVKGTKLIPFWNDYKDCFCIDDIPERQRVGWRYYAGFDYGKRNQTVLGIYAVDKDGNRYIAGEVAGSGERMGGVPGIAQRIKDHPLFDKFRTNIKADPSLWNKNQAKQQGGYTSIAKLFQSEGINLKSAPLKGSDADKIAIERLLYHYWANPAEPTLYIFSSARLHIKQFRNLRYRDWSEAMAQNKPLQEELVDRDNDSWDAWKYAEAARPAPANLKRKPPSGSFMAVRDSIIRHNRKPQGIRGNRKPNPLTQGPVGSRT